MNTNIDKIYLIYNVRLHIFVSSIKHNMKIALPTKSDSMVDDHFGHCAFFSVVTVTDGRMADVCTLPAPEGCGCKSGVAVTLRQMGVSVLLAGNMGDGAKAVLEAQGIRVVRGCSGSIAEVVDGYLSGRITDSGDACAHSHEQCGHLPEGGFRFQPSFGKRS